MNKKLKNSLTRLALTLLLSSGVILTFLGVLDLSTHTTPALLSMLGLSIVLEWTAWNRKTLIAGICLLAAGTIYLLVRWDGIAVLRDVLAAFSLRFSGVSGAMPLVARETSLLISLVFTLLCFLSARANAGAYPASLFCLAAVILLWQGNRIDLVPMLFPAMIAAMTLFILDHHGEASFLRLLSLCAALVLLAWGIIPHQGVVYPPLKSAADSLRQTILDHLFFTEPRDVFSLSTEGYYPQGTGQMGGPISPSDHPVMQVSTPKVVYLRGVLLNEYNGRSWKNTLGGRRYLWDGPSSVIRRTQLFDQNLPEETLASTLTEPSDISVRMLSDGASTLFLPQRVREIRVGGEVVPYFSDASEVFATRNLQASDTWAVSAPLFLAGDSGLGTLVDAAAVSEDPQWESLKETYLELPSHLEEPVWQLAMDWTADLDSPYEKALAIQSHLRREYRYTLDVEPQDPTLDFVTHFLFNTQQGYCTYFASAMTVLCRMAGLPARYVEGYLARPDEHGEALVTGLDAHAWTEVYFKGFGWLTFDATPQSGRADSSDQNPDEKKHDSDPKNEGEENPSPTPSPSQPSEPTPSPNPDHPPESNESDVPDQPTPTSSPASNEETASDSKDEQPDTNAEDAVQNEANSSISNPFSTGLLFLLLLLLLLILIILRWIFTSPEYKAKKAKDENQRFDIWTQECVNLLAARKLYREPGETPMSYTRRLDEKESLSFQMALLGERIALLRYSPLTPLPEDTEITRAAAKALRQNLFFPIRLRYIVRRLLPFSKRETF